jgi:ATP-dependent Lon protease
VTQAKETRDKGELRKLPMMPIRDMVIFPYMMTPFVVGRESSVRALEEALTGDRKIFLATQHDAGIDEPRPEDIYNVGTIGNIVQSVKMPDGNIKVLVEGLELFWRHSAGRQPAAGSKSADRAGDAARHFAVRAVRKTTAISELRDHDRCCSDG